MPAGDKVVDHHAAGNDGGDGTGEFGGLEIHCSSVLPCTPTEQPPDRINQTGNNNVRQEKRYKRVRENIPSRHPKPGICGRNQNG